MTQSFNASYSLAGQVAALRTSLLAATTFAFFSPWPRARVSSAAPRVLYSQGTVNPTNEHPEEKMMYAVNTGARSSEEVERAQANRAIDIIAELPENWNDNGAPPFSAALIERARRVLNSLAYVPVVTPTAMPSIQMDYRDEKAGYLEFEIYEDERVKQYTRKRGAKRGETRDNLRAEDIPSIVHKFYNGVL